MVETILSNQTSEVYVPLCVTADSVTANSKFQNILGGHMPPLFLLHCLVVVLAQVLPFSALAICVAVSAQVLPFSSLLL